MSSSQRDPYDMSPQSSTLSRSNTNPSSQGSRRPSTSRALVLALSSGRDLVTSQGRPRASSTREYIPSSSHRDSVTNDQRRYEDSSRRINSHMPGSSRTHEPSRRYESHLPSSSRHDDKDRPRSSRAPELPSRRDRDRDYNDRYLSPSRTTATPSHRYDLHSLRDPYTSPSRTANAASALTAFNRGNPPPSRLQARQPSNGAKPDVVVPSTLYNDHDDSNDDDLLCGGPLDGGKGGSQHGSSSYSYSYEFEYHVRVSSSSRGRNSDRC